LPTYGELYDEYELAEEVVAVEKDASWCFFEIHIVDSDGLSWGLGVCARPSAQVSMHKFIGAVPSSELKELSAILQG
jgi:hypothetical protein